MYIEFEQIQRSLDWLKTKLYLNSISSGSKSRLVKRGQVYRCNFGFGIGSEMQKDRPAVILQNDVGNSRSGNTIVAPITHDKSTLPCMAPITSHIDEAGNIILDGQANISNLMCVSKARLGNYICTLSATDMKSIDQALAKTLNLMGYYSDILKKLNDKLSYIDRIKTERNNAQDELREIKRILCLSENDSLTEQILKMKNSIDTVFQNS